MMEAPVRNPQSANSKDFRPPVLLLSSFEPEEPRSYFKLPGSGDRLFHYEGRLGLIMIYWDPDMPKRFPNEWREAVKDRVHRQWKSIRAYLRWRVLQYLTEHPELPPPTQAILRIRIFRTPEPGQQTVAWGEPIDLALARWQPCREPAPGSLPVEAFDPVDQRFVTLQEGN